MIIMWWWYISLCLPGSNNVTWTTSPFILFFLCDVYFFPCGNFFKKGVFNWVEDFVKKKKLQRWYFCRNLLVNLSFQRYSLICHSYPFFTEKNTPKLFFFFISAHWQFLMSNFSPEASARSKSTSKILIYFYYVAVSNIKFLPVSIKSKNISTHL